MVIIGGMRSLLGPGARRAVLHPVPRVPVDLDAELAAVLRPAVRRLHRVLADRPGRRLAAADRALRRSGDRSRGDGGRARSSRACRCPRSCVRTRHDAGDCAGGATIWRKRSAASRRCSDASIAVGARIAARADRTQRCRQDDGVQSDLRAVRARPWPGRAGGRGRSPGCRRIESSRPGSRARSRSPICFPALVDRTRTCGSRCRRATRRISTAGSRRSAIEPVTQRHGAS